MQAPDFWAAPEPNATAPQSIYPVLLGPLGLAYDLAGRLRRATARPDKITTPVICVGNLVAGGAGKTPVVLALVKALQDKGIAAHVLTRGYGGAEVGPQAVDPTAHGAPAVGDEALILARAAPTWVSHDRAAGARAAAAAGAPAIVMDDGYQNPTLVKDLSLLVIDGGYGFGNGKVIPAGPLREHPARGLGRAGAVVIIGPDRQGISPRIPSRLPLLRADLQPDPDAAALRGQRVIAFAGIGQPQKLFDSLTGLGAELVAQRGFPDHHPYTAAELDELRASAKAQNAILVTTEKDAARLAADQRDGIAVLRVDLVWRNAALLDRLLDPIFAPTEATAQPRGRSERA